METGDAVAGALEHVLGELLRQRLQVVQPVTPPAAGAEWSAVVPAGEAWELVLVRAQLVTSAVVANRAPALVLKDPNRTLLTLPTNVVQTAGLTSVYQWARQSGSAITAVPAVGVVNALPELVLPEGSSVGSLTGAIDGGDQYSGVVLVFRQWSLSDCALAADWFARREWPSV